MSHTAVQPCPQGHGPAQLWCTRPNAPRSEGQLQVRAKRGPRAAPRTLRQRRAAHTPTAVNDTIYTSQGEMTKHHRFL